MGRAGRKREGRIIILLAEGKEEGSYNTSLSKKKNIYKTIQNSAKSLKFYPHNPPMMPKDHRPKCHEMFISVNGELNDATASKAVDSASEVEEDDGEETTSKKKKSKAQPQKKTKKSLDVEQKELEIQSEESNDTAAIEIKKTKPKSTKKLKAIDEPILLDDDTQTENKTVSTLKPSVTKNATTVKQTKLENFISNDKKMVTAKPLQQVNLMNPTTSNKSKENLLNSNTIASTLKKPLVKETTNACFVSNLPDAKLFGNINRITSETFDKIKLDELVKQWRSDEDDFLFRVDTASVSANTSLNYLNESEMESNLNKYQKCFDQFQSNVSCCEETDCEEETVEDRMETEYQDVVVDDELFEDDLIKNMDFDAIGKTGVVQDVIENAEEVEMKSIVNDTLSYDDCQMILNQVANNRVEAVSSLKTINSIKSNKALGTTSNKESNLEVINFFGAKLEDIFNSSDDADDYFEEPDNKQSCKTDVNIEKSKPENVNNSDDDDKDILNHLLLCDKILENIQCFENSEPDSDRKRIESMQKDFEDKSKGKFKFGEDKIISKDTKPGIEREFSTFKQSPLILQKRSTSTPLGKLISFNNKMKESVEAASNDFPDKLNTQKKQNKSICSLNDALNQASESKNTNTSSNIVQDNQIIFDMNIDMIADLFNDDDDEDENNSKSVSPPDIITDSVIVDSFVNEKSKNLMRIEPKQVAVVKPLNFKNDDSGK